MNEDCNVLVVQYYMEIENIASTEKKSSIDCVVREFLL